jgi:hypothetical protein
MVLKEKFNMEDFWSRYEWQGRGSSQSHGLFWFEGSPPSEMADSAARLDFAQIWDTTFQLSINPTPDLIGQGDDGGNPLNVDSLNTPVTWEWLARILNRCQRHR